MKFTPQALNPYLSARHYFGAEQRRHRERADLSLVQLADILNSSKSTLARIETAELLAPPDLPRKLDAAFGTGDHFHGLYQLAKREAHPDQYRRYMDLDAQAEIIEQYGAQAVPGLLQTEPYARAYIKTVPGVPPEKVEERVALRMARKERQHADPPPFRWAIVDESALRRQVGDKECMFNQLASLLAQVDTPDSKIQVMPFSAGPHSLMGGSLTLLTLTDGSTMAYEEGIDIGHLYEDRGAVKAWRLQYELVRANALSLSESAKLIRKTMEEYQPCETPPS
ncbi:helix-turn-helix transcriptional regulator [Streptomyces sp. JV176]|uniref:helix-turn-helix domain-containing protein n=1 Tax=Streptomyces sp. JV176 TaxID=858630 RepID=UPI002E7637E4|nr:helix-turn-helix transcriptional regulator [Streptomyces sp. JV176]MEE1801504.1 helix-turn-helix transcriptional regulator [Streptomyces sp. JV176]